MMNYRTYNGNYFNYADCPCLSPFEKRELRRIYSRTALALIVCDILSVMFFYAFSTFLFAAGYTDIIDADGKYVISAGIVLYNFLSVTFALISSSIIFGSAFHLNVTELFSVEKVTPKKLLLTALICMGTANAVYVVNMFSSSAVYALGYEMDTNISSLSTPTGEFGDIVTSVLIAPVFEEIFYRGIIFRNLCRADKRFAIFVSAAIFGLIHGNPYQFLLGFAVGIVFAYADLKMNSIIPSIIGHIAVNSHLYIYDMFTGPYEYFFMYILMAVFIFAGLIAFVYTLGKYGIDFPACGDRHRKRGFPILVSSVPAWLFFIYEIYNVLSVFSPISEQLEKG